MLQLGIALKVGLNCAKFEPKEVANTQSSLGHLNWEKLARKACTWDTVVGINPALVHVSHWLAHCSTLYFVYSEIHTHIDTYGQCRVTY